MELPATTTSSLISELLNDLKDRIKNKEYGLVGLNFVIHNSTVVRFEKVDVTSCKEAGNGHATAEEIGQIAAAELEATAKRR